MDELDSAVAEYRRALALEASTRERLHALIRVALASGKRGVQVDLVRRTGFSRETLRKIARAAEDSHQA